MGKKTWKCEGNAQTSYPTWLSTMDVSVNEKPKMKYPDFNTQIKPFIPNAILLYSLKTSETIRKGALGKNGLNDWMTQL